MRRAGFRNLIFVAIGLLAGPMAAGAAHAADLKLKIDNCGCDTACYTGNVTKLSCSKSTISFRSNGLPDLGDEMMIGITASNQQFPTVHDFQFSIIRHPTKAKTPKATVPGAVGVAVNGVPIFDPSTQGPADPVTGKRPSAYEAGELDMCGGHAGRGDDYHYHMAPKCLIDDLGPQRIDVDKQPIGFAMDGYPILALGWFDKANDIEAALDDCRGATDANGNYFYNVENVPDYLVLNCFTGVTDEHHFARDQWTQRKDLAGNDMIGIPVPFVIKTSETRTGGGATCSVMTGTLKEAQVLKTDGSVDRLSNKAGTLFYCNAHCYGAFLEADPVSGAKGRVVYYENPTDKCPAILGLSKLTLFDAYEGPAQSRKAPPGTSANGG